MQSTHREIGARGFQVDRELPEESFALRYKLLGNVGALHKISIALKFAEHLERLNLCR